MTGYFITGTDTGVGKTWITVGLMAALQKQSAKVAGMKPVASGCKRTATGLRSDDALRIQAQCDTAPTYEQVNPYAFEPPVAPHAAAAGAGVSIELSRIASCYEYLSATADAIVIEGVGGWRVPLGDSLTLKDLACALQTPVILVVGLKLGCINHALLTAAAINDDGAQLAGWVANQLEPDYAMCGATLDFLGANIAAPMIGFVPFMGHCAPEQIAACLALGRLNV